MYQLPLDKIPWEIKKPPLELVQLLNNKQANKSRALDIGCGSGNYSIYLAQKGFKVTGVDVSKAALKLAERSVKQHKVRIKFIYCDANNLSKSLKGKFDLIFDYSLLHHIKPSQVSKYASQFSQLLKRRGKLLLVCYSEKDVLGRKSIIGKYGNAMYFRTKDEIISLYKSLRSVFYKPARLGKRFQHKAHCFLFEKL